MKKDLISALFEGHMDDDDDYEASPHVRQPYDSVQYVETPEEQEEEFYPGSKRRKKPREDDEPEPWRSNYTIKLLGGEQVKFYPIGALASALDSPVNTVLYWTKVGYLPLAPYRLPSNMVVSGRKVAGRRLFTEEMIDAAVEAFAKRGLLHRQRIEWREHIELTLEIKREWERLHKVRAQNNPQNNPRRETIK